MIDICYYNSQIKEEIDGACDYIKRATKFKVNHPDWAKIYIEMADAELSHAANLVKIFEDDFSKNKGDDPIYQDLRSSLLNMYTESVAKVKYMQQVFSSK